MLRKFSQYIAERADHENEEPSREDLSRDELNQLSSSGVYDMTFDERTQGLINEWGKDPQVEAIVTLLNQKVTNLVEDYFPEGGFDARSDFDEYLESLYELGVDEMGLLEYLIIQNYGGTF